MTEKFCCLVFKDGTLQKKKLMSYILCLLTCDSIITVVSSRLFFFELLVAWNLSVKFPLQFTYIHLDFVSFFSSHVPPWKSRKTGTKSHQVEIGPGFPTFVKLLIHSCLLHLPLRFSFELQKEAEFRGSIFFKILKFKISPYLKVSVNILKEMLSTLRGVE